jgi:carbon-monoxide dehydrogenase large subunit
MTGVPGNSGKIDLDNASPPPNAPFNSIGLPLRRKEDQRLLTGRGQFSDDFSLQGQVFAAMLRSPHPHARILAIDSSAARAMPGVLAI